MDSLDILERLVGFPTVSLQPNRGLMQFVSEYLASFGIGSRLVSTVPDERTNLFATIGPAGRKGVMLSGHTDVVPADNQEGWTVDPFRLTRNGELFFGRGTADMKGFVACALAAAGRAAGRRLASPLHLALSYDEEIGCIGVRDLIPAIASTACRPAFCIVGEPTSMAVATGHKGKTAYRAVARGVAGHSALAPLAVNAIHLGTELVSVLRRKQQVLAEAGRRDDNYTVPCTTVHVGKIVGGTQLNIVPDRCTLDFEIRNLPGDDPDGIIRELDNAVRKRIAPVCGTHAGCGISYTTEFGYPGLETPANSEIVRFVRALAETGGLTRVDFGTEGGLFSEQLNVPTIVCGPGSMEQGHKPDEYIAMDQVRRCDRMMDSLLDVLESGL